MYNDQTWFLKRAQMAPAKLACVDIDSGQQWSYAQFAVLINEWVIRLSNKKLQKGDRVAILAANHPELIAILFACGLKGYIYVPLNFRLTTNELTEIISNCEPTLLITDNTYTHIAHALLVEENVLNRQTSLTKNKLSAALQYDSSISVDSPWMIIYTGGTTGKSKGVQLSYNNVNWNALNTIVSWGLSDSDCTVTYMPLFHTGGLNALSIPILMAGGTVVVGHRFDAEQALREIIEWKATISLFVPTMYQEMIQTKTFNTSEFPNVRAFLSGGAPCPIKIYEKFLSRGLPFKEGYGLSEAGPNNFFIDVELAKIKKGSVGKSMQFVDVVIVSDTGLPCAINEVGELWIRGNHVFTGYWRNDEETNAAMHREWLKTGDLAKMDVDGDYYIVGRKKDMILTGGENVYPLEVEHCLIESNMIKEVAVIGLKDTKWGEMVTAFIALKHPNSYDEKQLIEHCRQYIAGYKIPKRFVVVAELPKTHVGKIDKKRLIDFL